MKIKADKTEEEYGSLHMIGRRRNTWWKFVIAVLIFIIYLLPIYVLVMTSFKSVQDNSTRMSFPQVWYVKNYIDVIKEGTIFRAYFNSALIAFLVVVCEIFVASIAAYPLARYSNRVNKTVFNFFMAVMIIPPLTILVGVYTYLTKIKALNTYWGITLTLVAFGIPTAIFLYTNFIKSVPKELDEAAVVDGAGVLTTFISVIWPQLKPITVTIIILHGVSAWNEYAYSMYILQKPSMMTITLLIRKYFSGVSIDYGGACAAATLAILPLIIIYLILQDQFIQGQVDSAVKG